MGGSCRKSIPFGPFRLNFSGRGCVCRGCGASAWAGPRGNSIEGARVPGRGPLAARHMHTSPEGSGQRSCRHLALLQVFSTRAISAPRTLPATSLSISASKPLARRRLQTVGSAVTAITGMSATPGGSVAPPTSPLARPGAQGTRAPAIPPTGSAARREPVLLRRRRRRRARQWPGLTRSPVEHAPNQPPPGPRW